MGGLLRVLFYSIPVICWNGRFSLLLLIPMHIYGGTVYIILHRTVAQISSARAGFRHRKLDAKASRKLLCSTRAQCSSMSKQTSKEVGGGAGFISFPLRFVRWEYSMDLQCVMQGNILGYGHKNRKLRVAKQGSERSGDKNVWKTKPCNSL